MADRFGRDLHVRIDSTGQADLVLDTGPGNLMDLGTVAGRDNLAQALKLRLLVERAELTALGHPRHGSRLHELIGEPMDRGNLELLRRYVRRALLDDPRVEEVTSVTACPSLSDGSVALVEAVVAPAGKESGEPLGLSLTLDFG